jgi:protein BUR2
MANAVLGEYTGASLDDYQWIFTEDELRRTPSILDLMPAQKEGENRAKGANFIIQCGIMLKLPQVTLETAVVFLHRFYMRHSMVDKPGQPGWHYYVGLPQPRYHLNQANSL